jgi:hypothetical protein
LIALLTRQQYILSIRKGFEREVSDAIDQWEETAEIEIEPPDPKSPLQVLLRAHYENCEAILDWEGGL